MTPFTTLRLEPLEYRCMLSFAATSISVSADARLSDPTSLIQESSSSNNPADDLVSNAYIAGEARASIGINANTLTVDIAANDDVLSIPPSGGVYYATSDVLINATFTLSSYSVISFSAGVPSNTPTTPLLQINGRDAANSGDAYLLDPFTPTTEVFAPGNYSLFAATQNVASAVQDDLSHPYDGSMDSSMTFTATILGAPSSSLLGTINWDSANNGSVDLAYSVSNAATPADTSAALYWASGTTADTVIGSPIYNVPIPSGTAPGAYGPINVPLDPSTEPAGATDLVLISDPGNALGFGPSVQWVQLLQPEVAMVSVSSPQPNSLSFAYTVSNSDIGQQVHVGFFESATPTYDPAAANVSLGSGVDLQPGSDTTVGEHTQTVTLAQNIPVDFQHPYVLAVVDPAQILTDVTETNNTASFFDAIDLSPLAVMSVGGGFALDPQTNRYTFAGTVLVGLAPAAGQPFQPLLQLVGTASFDANTIQLSGGVSLDTASSQAELFDGTWTIPVGQGGSGSISIATPAGNFMLAGLEMTVSAVQVTDQGVAIQGAISIPANATAGSSGMTFTANGSAVISVQGSEYIEVSEGGIAIMGGQLQLPNIALNYQGVAFQATGMAVGYSGANDTLTIQGAAMLKTDGGTTVIANFAAPNSITIQKGIVNYIGTVSLSDISLGSWTLDMASITMDTTTQSFSTSVTVVTPAGWKLSGCLGFIQGEVDAIKFGAASITGGLPLGTSSLFLQSISGEIDNLFDENPAAITFKGSLVLTEGPLFTLSLPSWLGGTVSGTAAQLDINGWFTSTQVGGSATLIIAGGLLQAEGTFSLDELTGAFSENATFSAFGGVGTFSGTLTRDASGNVFLEAAGATTLPGISVLGYSFPPTPLANAVIVVQYGTSLPYADDSMTISGSLFGSDPVSLKVDFDGNYSVSTPALSDSLLQSTIDTESTPTFQVSDETDLETLVADIANLSQPPTASTITIDLASGSYGGLTIAMPPGVTLNLTGTSSSTLIGGASSALIVDSGTVEVNGMSLLLPSNSPAEGPQLLVVHAIDGGSEPPTAVVNVNGGAVMLRNDQIIVAAGQVGPGVSVSNGSLDLGTQASPGGNDLYVNGASAYVQNLTSEVVPTFGDVFFRDSVAVTPAPPMSAVTQLPARSGTASFTVNWTGSPASEGLPVASYAVFVSTDGAPYTRWLSGVSTASGVFSGQIGHTYSFYSMAVDSSGNSESPHNNADTTIVTTLTPWDNPANALDVNGDGVVTSADAVVVIGYLDAHGTSMLPSGYPIGASYLDVNGDGAVTPIDALIVINFLNGNTAPAVGAVAQVGALSVVGVGTSSSRAGGGMASSSLIKNALSVTQASSLIGMAVNPVAGNSEVTSAVAMVVSNVEFLALPREAVMQSLNTQPGNATVWTDGEFWELLGVIADSQVSAAVGASKGLSRRDVVWELMKY